MAGHHDAGFHIDHLRALIAEKNRLVRSIMEFARGSSRRCHDSTIEALGEFLGWFSGEGEFSWLRIYDSYPAWQQQSNLLVEEWNRDDSLQKAKVIFTLITAQGRTISRTALGGGTWKSTGADKIASDLVLGKLYFKPDGANTPRARDGGFTAFEFHLPMDLQPRVAICVLHPTGYHNTVRDLNDYIHEGWFMGGNQGNLRMEQPSEQMYQDAYGAGAGFMNGRHFDYPNNRASNSGRDILGANQVDQMAVQREGHYFDSLAGFVNGLHVDCTIDSTEGCFMGGNQANLVMEQSSEPIHPDSSVSGAEFMNGSHVDYTNDLASNSGSSGYYPPAGIQMDIPSNTYPMDDDMSYMPSEINMFGGQYSHANAMSIQIDYCNTSFWNSNMHAPIQDATTSYSQPSIHSSASLDEPFDQLLLSEYYSMPELGGQNSHADGTSTQNYYYNPY